MTVNLQFTGRMEDVPENYNTDADFRSQRLLDFVTLVVSMPQFLIAFYNFL